MEYLHTYKHTVWFLLVSFSVFALSNRFFVVFLHFTFLFLSHLSSVLFQFCLYDFSPFYLSLLFFIFKEMSLVIEVTACLTCDSEVPLLAVLLLCYFCSFSVTARTQPAMATRWVSLLSQIVSDFVSPLKWAASCFIVADFLSSKHRFGKERAVFVVRSPSSLSPLECSNW